MSGVGPFEAGIRDEKVPRDRLIAALADRQHGVVALRQLLAMGFGRGAIAYRVAAGRLHLVYPGVYAVGHTRFTARGRWLAAVLACGPAAVLSHRDAAALWGLRQRAHGDIDVTAPGRSRHRRRGIAVHRPRRLDAADCTEVEAIPVTTVHRTLLDMAEVVSQRKLRHAIEQSVRLDLFDLAALESAMSRGRGRRGLKPLHALLAEVIEPPAVRSELELAFLDLCRSAHLPAPFTNVTVAGFVVDAFWPRERLVVELDGYAWHRTRDDLERDDAQIVALQLAGYRVLRFTHRRLTREPHAVANAVRVVLSQPAAPFRLPA